jgi:hypothetical protein
VQYPPLIKEPLIGVISPYKSQVGYIKQRLREVLPETAANVDVNTIDGFQGREKDVILFSTVRTATGKDKARIGFVADERRINVGLTRARCSLIVVGNRKALEKDYHWGSLLQSVSDRGCDPVSSIATKRRIIRANRRWRAVCVGHIMLDCCCDKCSREGVHCEACAELYSMPYPSSRHFCKVLYQGKWRLLGWLVWRSRIQSLFLVQRTMCLQCLASAVPEQVGRVARNGRSMRDS